MAKRAREERKGEKHYLRGKSRATGAGTDRKQVYSPITRSGEQTMSSQV